MGRRTVYIPDDLAEQWELAETEGSSNLSREFQQFLRARLERETPPSRRKPTPVRPLREADIDRVIELWNQTDDEWSLTPMAERNVRRNLRASINDSRAFCLVAEEDGAVVGFVTAALLSHPISAGLVAEIEELKVDRAHRRRGFGRALARDAVRWIENAGVRIIRVHALPENLAAIKLFEELGFDQDMITLNRWPR